MSRTETMSEAEFWKRVAVLGSAMTGTLLCDFADFHEAAEELLGYPVMTHEFTNPQLMSNLSEAAKSALRDLVKSRMQGESA